MKLLQLLQFAEMLSGRVREALALARRMREEGREELTAEELAGLQANDDAARAALTAAIERAKAEDR